MEERTPIAKRSGLHLLADRSYRLLWAGQTISSFGDLFIAVALPFAVLAAGHGVGGLGLVLAARSIPSVLFLLASGVVADRFPRRFVMLGSDAVRAVVHFALAALLAAGEASVGAFAVLEAVFGAADAFFNPATQGLIPELVPKKSLQQANGFLSLSRNIVNVAAPAIAGVVVVTIGPSWAFAIDGLTFVASGVCLALLRVPPRERTQEHASFLSELADGWRFVASVRWLWFTIATFAVNNVFFVPLFVLGPVVAKSSLGGAKTWGFIIAGGSVGAVVGAAAAVRFPVKRPLFAAYLLSPLMGLPLLFIAKPLAPWVIATGQALAWVSVSFGNALWFTVLQRHVPPDKISRTSAVDDFGSFVLGPIAFALVGPISAAVGVSTTLLVSGLALVIFPAVQMLIMPDVRRM